MELRSSSSFANLFLPRYCLLCGTGVQGNIEFCQPCRSDLPEIPSACPRCASPMHSSITCGRCLVDPPPYEQCIVPFHYAYPITSLVKAAKFGGQFMLAFQLGRLLAATLEYRLGVLPECLIPIPLHRNRLTERGFNQSLELARPIARRFKLPINFTDCVRIRHTAPQARLSGLERQLNVRFAFAVQRELRYRHVALVDDVVTTGHTAAELCSQLIKAGVARVDVWALARA